MPHTAFSKAIPIYDRIRLEYGTEGHIPVKARAFLDRIICECPEPGTQFLLGEYTLFLLTVPTHGTKSYRSRILHFPFLTRLEPDAAQILRSSEAQDIQAAVDGNIACHLERLNDPSAIGTAYQVNLHFSMVLSIRAGHEGQMDKAIRERPTADVSETSSSVTVRRVDGQGKSISELLDG